LPDEVSSQNVPAMLLTELFGFCWELTGLGNSPKPKTSSAEVPNSFIPDIAE
jgi:hypothetical protein